MTVFASPPKQRWGKNHPGHTGIDLSEVRSKGGREGGGVPGKGYCRLIKDSARDQIRQAKTW